ncbi:MAG: archaeosortase/exosortase family protein, partial [Candidatus Omnitrophica bacterium]|nr:archaeosortase/exosortase family protein [Candidatus Omnitrophota bacterium]
MKKYIKEGYLKIALVALIVNMIYLPTFMWMWVRWFRVDSYYSHGLLVPFVALYLIWSRRKEYEKIESKREVWGLYLIVPALFIHLSSAWMKIYFTSGFSLILLIIG